VKKWSGRADLNCRPLAPQSGTLRLTKNRGESTGFDDVPALCGPISSGEKESSRDEKSATEIVGFVYLMKHGKYYKIGKTNAMGRREYELAIQLPEKLRTVHTIKTDDPDGTEEYWHKRFTAKRGNGDGSTSHQPTFRRSSVASLCKTS